MTAPDARKGDRLILIPTLVDFKRNALHTTQFDLDLRNVPHGARVLVEYLTAEFRGNHELDRAVALGRIEKLDPLRHTLGHDAIVFDQTDELVPFSSLPSGVLIQVIDIPAIRSAWLEPDDEPPVPEIPDEDLDEWDTLTA